ncbi:YkgJ family cysteine cluster protein [Luteimonas sp. MC1825]|uniref:YkgJ family cysteine cluster protein n=1 Tax=Luteimonas sp. MC1825 TaxID=2761107 RepID=UPI00161D2022|nr:YkgJ family cysteine cluster protein [Luteimonas sp. MC1825]MBB6598149.1 YkgJ family cysteine cluster protein [Luteimonas sp. MC1825]QOC88380.1 YkgJ family cysteine cluster protein [Luteimonas sp. MC1825]
MPHPCLSCGACCAFYRVSFHWSEADPALDGRVPPELTTPLRSHERAMLGTFGGSEPRCVALDADIGRYSRCTIHPVRPQACRDVPASWEFGAASRQCDNARVAHGLPALTRADWAWREAAANDRDGNPDGNDTPNDGGSPPPALPPPIAA